MRFLHRQIEGEIISRQTSSGSDLEVLEIDDGQRLRKFTVSARQRQWHTLEPGRYVVWTEPILIRALLGEAPITMRKNHLVRKR